MSGIKQKVKWLLKNCRSSIPFVISLIIIGSVTSLLSVGKSLISKYLIDEATLGNKSGIVKWGIILGVLLILHIIITSVNTILNNYSYEKLRNSIQQNMYNKIIKSKWYNLSKFHSVDLLTRMTNDVATICNLIVNIIPEIFSLFVMLISSFVALLSLSKTMSIFALIIFPILIFLSKIYGRKLKYFYIEFQKKESRYSKFLQESFNNILIVKSFCLENEQNKKMEGLQNDRLTLSNKKSIFASLSNGMLSFSSFIGYFVVVVWGAFNIAKKATTFGSLTAMIQLFASVQAPIYGLSSAFPKIISAFGAIDRLNDIEKIDSETYVPKIYNTSAKASIEFKNVSFSYNDEKEIISNANFKINPSETIGLIGPSGEGKTTLIRLILSLLEPNKGEIYINDEEINTSHRQLISYVPQGNTLFSGTIRENLSVSDNITEEDMIEALKKSCAYDFVYNFKDNLDTIIGERGLGISEGQAQRLCIARAFLKKSPILILDESTSSLDGDTEYKILNSIKSLTHKPTCIIITHRPSALSICNKIFKLENSNLNVQEQYCTQY